MVGWIAPAGNINPRVQIPGGTNALVLCGFKSRPPYLTLRGWCTSGYDAPDLGEYDSPTRVLALIKRKSMPVPNRS